MPEPARREKLHQFVTSNPYISIIFTFFLLVALFLGKGGNMREGPDAFTTFALGWFFLSTIAFTGVDKPGDISKAIGLNTPIKGYNFILASLGVGIGISAFTLANQFASIVPQNSIYASIASPLYNPYTAFPSQFSITSAFKDFTEVILYNFALVALFEEIYKIIIMKNISNYLYQIRGWTQGKALGTGLLTSFSIWASWHVFSWPDFGIFSLISAIGFGLIFWSGWIITDFLGGISDVGKIVLTSVLLMPAVTSHGTWNSLQAFGGTPLTYTAELIAGLSLVASALLAMWIVRRRFQIITDRL